MDQSLRQEFKENSQYVSDEVAFTMRKELNMPHQKQHVPVDMESDLAKELLYSLKLNFGIHSEPLEPKISVLKPMYPGGR